MRKTQYILGCLGIVAAVILAVVTAYRFETGYLSLRSFDANAWRNVQTVHDERRLHMVDALMRGRQLDRLKRAQVLKLLGPPETKTNMGESESDLVYWLGPERGLIRIDSEWLVIGFGPDDRVSRYRVTRD